MSSIVENLASPTAVIGFGVTTIILLGTTFYFVQKSSSSSANNAGRRRSSLDNGSANNEKVQELDRTVSWLQFNLMAVYSSMSIEIATVFCYHYHPNMTHDTII